MYIVNTIVFFGAKYLIFLSIIIAGVYFLRQPVSAKRNVFILGAVSFALIGILGYVAIHAYINPRPFVVGHFTPLIPHSPDNGFPSDHVLVAAGIAASIFVFNRKMGLLLGVVALLIGICRVVAGIHHPLDVAASFLIAIVCALIGTLLYKKIGNLRRFEHYPRFGLNKKAP